MNSKNRSNLQNRVIAVLFAAFTFINPTLQAKIISSYSLETDPMTFAFEGYAAHFRFNPVGLDHWIFGIGTYSMKFPDLFVDMNPDNKDEGWDVQLQQGYGFFSEYYFNPSNEGWFVGSQIALQEYKVKNTGVQPKTLNLTNFVFMPYAGYRWYPTNGKVYIQPWMGMGYQTKIQGKTKLGSKVYDISPIIPFLTVHIGYSLDSSIIGGN